jgi:hypothetical protein
MEIENIEISYLTLTAFRKLRPFMVDSYKYISDEMWSEDKIKKLIKIFRRSSRYHCQWRSGWLCPFYYS